MMKLRNCKLVRPLTEAKNNVRRIEQAAKEIFRLIKWMIKPLKKKVEYRLTKKSKYQTLKKFVKKSKIFNHLLVIKL